MSISAKLLRVDKTGLHLKSAEVGTQESTTDELRLTEVANIPIEEMDVSAWILARYTILQLWNTGTTLTGAEKEAWLSLWQGDSTIESIETDLTTCDSDIVAIAALTTLAGAKPILTRICERQKRSLYQRKRIIRVLVRIIRLLAPKGEEAN
jgi:hypothetical protein